VSELQADEAIRRISASATPGEADLRIDEYRRALAERFRTEYLLPGESEEAARRNRTVNRLARLIDPSVVDR
jgi:hypothetical protein